MARVGDIVVTADAVRAIMAAQHVDARAACDLAIRDALFARAGLEQRVDVRRRRELDAARARALAEESHDAALAQGPVKREELEPFIQRDQFFVARPPAWLFIHALVQVDAKAPEDDVKRAEDVANAIHAAVLPVAEGARGAPDTAIEDILIRTGIRYAEPAYREFDAAAKSVDARGFKLTVEPVAPLAADGTSVVPEFAGEHFDPAFVAAGMKLERRGDLSAPTRSLVGWHVILLMGKTRAHTLPDAELEELYRVEVIAARAKALLNQELEKLRASANATPDRNVDALLALVRVDSAPQDRAQLVDPRGPEPR